MSATQHTPGPWAVSTLPKAYSVRRVDSSGVIASVARSSNDDRDEICYSDARLIAAAPDGVAFAEMVLLETARRGANADTLHADRKLWEAARAFIAKATGAP